MHGVAVMDRAAARRNERPLWEQWPARPALPASQEVCALVGGEREIVVAIALPHETDGPPDVRARAELDARGFAVRDVILPTDARFDGLRAQVAPWCVLRASAAARVIERAD